MSFPQHHLDLGVVGHKARRRLLTGISLSAASFLWHGKGNAAAGGGGEVVVALHVERERERERQKEKSGKVERVKELYTPQGCEDREREDEK